MMRSAIPLAGAALKSLADSCHAQARSIALPIQSRRGGQSATSLLNLGRGRLAPRVMRSGHFFRTPLTH